MVDDLISEKVKNPGVELGDNEVVRMVTKLIQLDGLDT